MESPLWTDAHAPDLDDLPQPSLREHLRGAVDEPMNLVLHGPRGVGKTAAARALAREIHDNPEADLVEINVADFFDRTKSEIREDPRFERFLQGTVPWTKQSQTADTKYKSQWSKAAMVNHVLKESASTAPADGEYKTILLDNAEAIREDFQQALRRVMERHHEAAQFVVATRQPSKLISPITSRCFPLPVRPPTTEEIAAVLEDVVEAEGVDYEPEGLEFVAGYADGDLRRALLAAQATAEAEGAVTRDAVYETVRSVGPDDRVGEMLDDALAGSFGDARSTLHDLLDDEGYDGGEVLRALLEVAPKHVDGDDLARLHRLAGEVDADLASAANDRVHVARMLADVGTW